MRYALINGDTVAEYPYSLRSLRLANPNTSFPSEMSVELLLEYSVVIVEDAPIPTFDPITQDVVEGTPTLVNGVWVQTWTVQSAPAGEVAERQKDAANTAAHSAVKADTFVGNFIAMTPAQVEAYIENNTSNLAATRALLKKMGVMLLILAKREFGG